ncbi:MAG: HypC/HybG/HupF family hydrogenase formation chaperone [Anaerolineales bacterium]
MPGKLVDIYDNAGLRMGKVDFGGVFREACLEYIPEARVGNYVVVHVGFAISLLSEQEAAETLAILREVSDIDAELATQPG